MPRRALLTADQRARLFAIPVDPAEMARHYLCDESDLARIRSKRRAVNRLGFAVQMCLFRFPGQGFGAGSPVPEPFLLFANQIGIDPTLFGDYARRDQTRREHAVEIQTLLGLRSFRLADWRATLEVGAEVAWSTDRGEPIVQAMLERLRAANVIVPEASVLERIGLAARARARKRAFMALTTALSEAESNALDRLLIVDSDLRRTPFAWLRSYSESPAPSNILGLLDRLEFVRRLKIGPERARRILSHRLTQMVEEGAIMTAQHMADLEPLRRKALLVAQVVDLETRLADATLAMFERYMGSLFTKAQNRSERRFQATKRDVAKTLALFGRTIDALKKAKAAGKNCLSIIEREIDMKRLDDAVPIIEAVTAVADQEILVAAAERYGVLRRFSPRFLEAFRFRSNTWNDRVLAALDVLKDLDRDGSRALPKRPPASFLPTKLRKLIFADGLPDRRLYETAVLATLRDRLKSGGIWIEGSRSYRAFEDYLLPVGSPEIASAKLGEQIDPNSYIAERAASLHERLTFVAARAERGDLDGVEIEDGKLYVERFKPTVTDAALELSDRLSNMLPRVRITELLTEVDRWIGFSDHFTHVRTGNPTADKASLLAAILADGTNLGLSRMADASRGLTYHRLVNVAQWHITEDNYASARAAIINAHHRHPMAGLWGDGTASSSDGQYFRSGGRAGPSGDVNVKYGIDPGVSLYTHVSDQYGLFHTRALTATVEHDIGKQWRKRAPLRRSFLNRDLRPVRHDHRRFQHQANQGDDPWVLRRDLSARQYVYVWADGVYLQARMEPQAECMLVLMGATPEGKKELIGFQTGMRESGQSWKELLVDLKARGLVVAPQVAIGDGALGFWKALDEAFRRRVISDADCTRH